MRRTPAQFRRSLSRADRQAVQRFFLSTLRRPITTELTGKQHQALAATCIHGMPVEHVARRRGHASGAGSSGALPQLPGGIRGAPDGAARPQRVMVTFVSP